MFQVSKTLISWLFKIEFIYYGYYLPPETGASTNCDLFSVACLSTVVATLGSTVELSISTVFFFAPLKHYNWKEIG